MVPVQSALRETAHQLRGQGQGPIAQYADKASEQVERFSGYLRETDVEEIVEEVRGVARRRPALFLGGAATLGFFATRFLKSSSQEQGGASSGAGSDAAPLATGRTAVPPYASGEPTTALPPGPLEGEFPTTAAGRPPAAGQAPIEGERVERPPRGY